MQNREWNIFCEFLIISLCMVLLFDSCFNKLFHFNLLKGCSSSGVYGDFCNKTCSENCMENACSIINGTCYGCVPGWVGEYCNDSKRYMFSSWLFYDYIIWTLTYVYLFFNAACPKGSYGSECKKCVGHCKDNKACNHSTGLCDNGCLDGWKGINCDQGIHTFYFFML